MERHFPRSRELFRTDRGRPCPREWEDPQAKRCGGMERSGSLCGRVAAPRETLHGRECGSFGKQPAGREHHREAAAGREHHREAAAGRGDRKNGLVVSQCLGKLCQRLLCLLRLWCLAVPCAGALHKVHAFAHYGIHKNHYRLV